MLVVDASPSDPAVRKDNMNEEQVNCDVVERKLSIGDQSTTSHTSLAHGKLSYFLFLHNI
jgi:hypothetical protein